MAKKPVKRCSVSFIIRGGHEGNFHYDGNVLYLHWGAVDIGLYSDKTDWTLHLRFISHWVYEYILPEVKGITNSLYFS